MDLNLIRVFIAIYETRSVSKAAEQLNVTQPTASYSLSRLRDLLEDQLFIRSRDGMIPTPQSDRIYPDFVSAVRGIQQTIEDSRGFDPYASTRRFTLAMSDIGEMVFLPPILARLRTVAPDVELEVVPPARTDLINGLASGEIAAAVGHFALDDPRIRHEPLFTEHYMCLFSRSHSQIGEELTPDLFAKGRHIHVQSAATGHAMIEETLHKAGIDRRIALSIPHYAILSHVVAGSDLLAILPSSVAAMFETYEPVRSAPIPFPIPSFDVQLHWNGNDDVSAANRWLRALIVSVLKSPPVAS